MNSTIHIYSGVEQSGSSQGSTASARPVLTKLKGDIAEQRAVLEGLRRGWGVLTPIGDRLPYDLLFDISGTFVRVQVKSAWLNVPSGNYVVDTRRTKTNRRIMKRERYTENDFDIALVYIDKHDIFYVFPASAFIRYGSEIHMVEVEKRQRKPGSAVFREAWEHIAARAVSMETSR